MKTGDVLDKAIAPIRDAYKVTKRAIEKLPQSRMRSLALTDLETSFSRAVFAASEIHDPIDGES